MDELVIIGKTVSTFGIKGELKVVSDFEKKELAYKINNKILINNIEHIITNIRYHKNYILLEIDNLKNINDILDYVGFNIYIKRSLLNLAPNEFLYKDLIDALVIDEDKTKLGNVVIVENGVNTIYLKVKGKKEFFIPLIDEYVKKIDIKNKVIYTNNAKSLIL